MNSLRLFARPPTVAASSDHSHLPLHVQLPPVPLLSWTRADDIVSQFSPAGEATLFRELSSIYRVASVARAVCDARDQSLDVAEARSCSFTTAELQILRGSGFLVPLARASSFVRLFAVVEEAKRRRRVISWPRALNHAEREWRESLRQAHADVPFPHAATVRDRVRFRFAAQLDFKKFFQQFELITKEFFAVHAQGMTFGLATIPTGGVAPPLIAQVLSRALCLSATRAAGSQQAVFFDTMIDNIRLVSDDFVALSATWSALLDVCEHVGATIGDSQPPCSAQQPYTFLGMLFDHVCRSVAPSAKLVAKLRRADGVLALPVTSVRDISAVFGVCMWASIVTDFRLASVYYIFKFMRRYSRFDPSFVVAVWQSIRPRWRAWIRALCSSSYCFHERPSDCAELYTDASLSGWGAVVFDSNGYTRIGGAPWSAAETKHHINVLEALAAREGLKFALGFHRGPITITMHIDNTTTIASVVRGRSGNFIVNDVVGEIRALAQGACVALEGPHYIHTSRNPADAPSRSDFRPPTLD